VWIGLILAYDSYDWPHSHGWPASFFIVTLVLLAYLAAGLGGRRGRRGQLEPGGR
jgi:zinc/manganese transport system permease protein